MEKKEMTKGSAESTSSSNVEIRSSEPVGPKPEPRSERNSVQELTAAQSAIQAAKIAAFASLIVAVISLMGVVYNVRQSRSASLEVDRLKNETAGQAKRRERIAEALRKANESIKHMKHALQRVISDTSITVQGAEKILEEAATILNTTHEKYGDDVSAIELSLGKAFHDARKVGDGAYLHIKKKDQKNTHLSPDTTTVLEGVGKDLDESEKAIRLKYLWVTSNE